MPYKKSQYWDSQKTLSGNRDMYSEGSVADRGGNNENYGYTYTNFKPNRKEGNFTMPYSHDSTQYKAMGKPKPNMGMGMSMHKGGYKLGAKKKKTIKGIYTGSTSYNRGKMENSGGGY